MSAAASLCGHAACTTCGIERDASWFDHSRVIETPRWNEPELVLAEFALPQGYCGMLAYFSQLARIRGAVSLLTPGFEWQIRCDGQPRFPYVGMEHIVNPWGLNGFPIQLRLQEGCLVQLVLRRLGTTNFKLTVAGGRIMGLYWYNPAYGGAGR